ncbi:hypothetical protein QQZ08_011151 [Neonectria magnoliae]|uniref:Uncharacterized protein n=1 Tax=Neonectria magnoliae TaxID=2732573 RepID=A0ABR1HBZ4_9HYPO
MAGIAKTFREANGDTYLAGLWKRMIYSDLAWTTNASDGAQLRRSESYAPTWSWASVAGGYQWVKEPSKLAVYSDEAKTQCIFEDKTNKEPLHFDTADLVRKLAEAEEMKGSQDSFSPSITAISDRLPSFIETKQAGLVPKTTEATNRLVGPLRGSPETSIFVLEDSANPEGPREAYFGHTSGG